jgi:hypothetical protein
MDMGLKLEMLRLSPLLNKGLTTTYFKWSGKIPEDKIFYIYGIKVS